MLKFYKIPTDLLIILIWTLFASLFIIIPFLENSILRMIFGLPIVLFNPGYVLISALFPKKNDLGIIERIVLSFGLTVAVIPLIGLGLNHTFGIRLIFIFGVLIIYTISLIIIGSYRREKLDEKERFSVSFLEVYLDIKNELNKPRNKTDNILTIILILSILFAVGTAFYVITFPKEKEKFTEFYILNSSTKLADNYSTNLKLEQPVTYLVGVINHEYTSVNYTINVNYDKNILLSKSLKLDNNQKWEKDLTIVPEKKGDNIKLQFLLFKENNFTPYRELHLWINSTWR